MTEKYTDFDFGLSALAQRFHQDWSNEGTARDLAALSAAGWEGRAARQLLEDAARLLESPLPDWALTSLWMAATGREHNLAHLGIGGRDWLRQVVDVCVEEIRKDDPHFEAGVPTPAPDALTGAVLDEIQLAAPKLTAKDVSNNWFYVGGAVAALNLTATQASPDLAFRLLLRTLAKYWVPLEQAQYDRFVALGEKFDYGEFLVTSVDFLVGLDAD